MRPGLAKPVDEEKTLIARFPNLVWGTFLSQGALVHFEVVQDCVMFCSVLHGDMFGLLLCKVLPEGTLRRLEGEQTGISANNEDQAVGFLL